jgi:hypothetical protein
MQRLFQSFMALFLLAGCAGSDKQEAVEASTALAQVEASTSLGLPAQKLAPNECGLFLWSKTDISRFVFFARAGSKEALFLLDDTPTLLQSVSESGDIFGQFFTDVTYRTDTGRSLSLSYEAGETLTDGARISNGIMEYNDAEGWRVVLPLLGVRVCQPAVTGYQPVRNPAGG